MLTCAGRRSYAVEVFKRAVGDQSRVFACDSSAEVPALQKADKAFIGPPIDSEEYIDINPRIGGGYPFSHIAGAKSSGSVDRLGKRPVARPWMLSR